MHAYVYLTKTVIWSSDIDKLLKQNTKYATTQLQCKRRKADTTRNERFGMTCI